MKHDDLMIKVAAELNTIFWEKWKEHTNNLPDIEEAMILQVNMVEVGLLTILTNYIMGFKRQYRDEYLNEFVDKLRHILDKVKHHN